MRGIAIAVGLAALLLVAGCLSMSGDRPANETAPTAGDAGAGDGTAAAVAEGWAADAIPEDADHAHADRSHHEGLSTPNFDLLAWNPLVTSADDRTAGQYCGSHTLHEERDYTALQTVSGDAAVVIVDVTDPEDPELVGELVMPDAAVVDVDFVDGHPYLALATFPYVTNPASGTGSLQLEASGTTDGGTLRPTWTDACGTTYEGPLMDRPHPSSTVLVDVSDLTDPIVTDARPQPVLGPHNVHATSVDGEPLIVSSVTNWAHAAGYFSFYTVQEAPDLGGQLVEVGAWSAQGAADTDEPAATPVPSSSPHVDATIHEHPVTGDTLVYLANWHGGITILEYEGPHQLTHRATWTDYETTDFAPGTGIGSFASEGEMTGQWHHALPLDDTWGDQHYTVVHQETLDRPAERPTGMVAILDTTDPGDPVPMARWTLPVDAEWDVLKHFSTHYLDVRNRTIFTTVSHAGLWAIDASPEHWPEMPSVGVFVPHQSSPEPVPDANQSVSPFLGDVVTTEDAIVTWDAHGAYTLDFDAEMDVPVPDPWHEEPWAEIPYASTGRTR